MAKKGSNKSKKDSTEQAEPVAPPEVEVVKEEPESPASKEPEQKIAVLPRSQFVRSQPESAKSSEAEEPPKLASEPIPETAAEEKPAESLFKTQKEKLGKKEAFRAVRARASTENETEAEAPEETKEAPEAAVTEEKPEEILPRPSQKKVWLVMASVIGLLYLVVVAIIIWPPSSHITPKAPAQPLTPNHEQALLLAQISDQLQKKDVDGASQTLEQLRQIAPGRTFLENAAGTISAIRKDYPGAEAAYKSVLRQDPNNLAALFNLAEIEFDLKHWAEAESLSRQVLPDVPSKGLVAYHIFLCLLLQHHDEDAALILAKISPPPTSNGPAWYYAQAAQAFLEGKNSMAMDYVTQARNAYPDKVDAFETALQQLGYLKAQPASGN